MSVGFCLGGFMSFLAAVDHEIHVYPGAPHSFFDRRFEQYADACEDAWRRMLAFIQKHGG